MRTPPISTPTADSRGNPWAIAPTSVLVPPTSTTSASARPVRAAAPRIEFDGPPPIVRTGSDRAWPTPIIVPSFCERNGVAASPCPASARSNPSITRVATPVSAAFTIVAFSRSSSPNPPTSCPSETGRWSASRTSDATSRSCDGSWSENGPVIATASAPRTASSTLRISSRSSGCVRPSTSTPPRTTHAPAPTAARRSAGQPANGGIGARRRSGEAEHGHAPEVAAAQEGVQRVGGAERDAHDRGGVGGNDRGEGARDPLGRVLRRRRLRAGQDRAPVADEDRVRVGPADVDADPRAHPLSSTGTYGPG